MADNPVLAELHDLRFDADSTTVLSVPSLQIATEGLSVILGPNGAGKSVLLRLLHGILAPTQGRVSFPGRKKPPRQAMVFQRAVLMRRSVLSNVHFVIAASGGDKTRAPDLLARGGLGGRMHQPARTLSGGEQQRLALICALATNPEILFLDEPTSSLDPASTLAIENMITAAGAAGVKIIMVTHNIAQARRLADDIIFCHAGRVAEDGPADQVLVSPESEAVRDFLEGRLHP